jgi:hypothetical protein
LRRIGICRLASVIVALILLYVVGVFVRGHYGIAVSVRNSSGQLLREVRVQVPARGTEYNLGQLADGKQVRSFVQPRAESHVALTFVDATGPHVGTVVGYVEAGYCGKAQVEVSPGGKIRSVEKIDPLWCSKSWLDFF